MASINNALSNIINGKKDFCCLCLSSLQGEPIQINDEVIVNINNYEHEAAIAEVLNFIFDEGMYKYISTFDTICEQCTKSAIHFYKFTHTSRNNAEYLTKVLDAITNSFEYTTDELLGSKSLYVSLNVDDFTSKQYYDLERTASCTKAALRRFNALDNTTKLKVENVFQHKIKKEEGLKSNKVKDIKKRRRPRNSIQMQTKDMMFDKNNPNLFKCKVCLKEYPTIWNLRNHFIRVHAPKIFKCTECPRSYGSEAFLEAHKTESHCNVVCSECGKTFYNRHTLKMHEMGHHLSLVCQDCGRVYKNKATFRKHIELNVCGQETRAHPSEAKFTCDYCNKKYTQKVSLRVHIQYEHGNYKAHVCEWCGKKFWAQSRLKTHIIKHTKEKKFSCSVCGGKFVSKESLLYHTRIHTGEKPYKCPHCESRFLSASRRSDHVKRHHLGATLECEICQSKFSSRTFLLKHKKMHTKTVDKINFTYENFKLKAIKPNNIDGDNKITSPTKSQATENDAKDLWKIQVKEDCIPSFQQIMDSREIDLHQFTSQVYADEGTQQSAEDRKVYLEVSDDGDDYIKILGV